MPSSNSDEAKLKTGVSAALALHRQGDHRGAVGRLKRLVKSHPASGAVYGVLGKVYFEQDKFGEAAKWFQKTTAVAPDSELASLGLFHSLWQSDRPSEALAEAGRFLAHAESAEYAMILRDLTVAGELAPRREPAGAA